MNKYSLLIIYPGPVPPDRAAEMNRCFWISDFAKGWVVQPIWWSKDEARSRLDLDTNDNLSIGDFKFSFIHPIATSRLFKPLLNFYCLVKACWVACRVDRPDLIFTYGTNSTGVAGVIIKLLTGAKLIVEVPGVPDKAFILEEREVGVSAKFKKLIADFLLYFCLYCADGVKLLYPTQLNSYRVPKKLKRFCFHDLTPVSAVKVESGDEKTILLLGFPWHRKGVDVLIRAFRLIENEFPEHTLQIWGHCLDVDRPYYEGLAKGSSRIVLGKGVKFDEAITKLARCSVMVLPSRTEAMGRVILESYFLKKPVVAAAVDGIPHYISDGKTGLLFRSEDRNDLASKLRLILSDQELRNRLATNGQTAFLEQYSERIYAEKFHQLLVDMLS